MANVSKITFEYEDGTAKFITGEELERWEGFFRQLTIFATVQKMNPDWSKVKWTDVEQVEEQPKPKNERSKRRTVKDNA